MIETEIKEISMYTLKWRVLSQIYPQKNAAGIAENKANEVIIPISIKDPPITGPTMCRGIKTKSKPYDISWKKNPNRHIARETFQSRIKTFAQKNITPCENNWSYQNFHKSLIERGSISYFAGELIITWSSSK
jgi:hypothetical protein